jgi:hypothetical protein
MRLPIYFFVPQDWNILANVSLRVFTVDKVISSAQLGATFLFDVQVTLPSHFWLIDRIYHLPVLELHCPFMFR